MEVVEVSEAGTTLKRGRATGTPEAGAAGGTMATAWCSTRVTTIRLRRGETVEHGAGQHPRNIETTAAIGGEEAAGDTNAMTDEAGGVHGAGRGRRIGVIRVDNDSFGRGMAMLAIRFAPFYRMPVTT